jgi:hypothetical protein
MRPAALCERALHHLAGRQHMQGSHAARPILFHSHQSIVPTPHRPLRHTYCGAQRLQRSMCTMTTTRTDTSTTTTRAGVNAVATAVQGGRDPERDVRCPAPIHTVAVMANGTPVQDCTKTTGSEGCGRILPRTLSAYCNKSVRTDQLPRGFPTKSNTIMPHRTSRCATGTRRWPGRRGRAYTVMQYAQGLRTVIARVRTIHCSLPCVILMRAAPAQPSGCASFGRRETQHTAGPL